MQLPGPDATPDQVYDYMMSLPAQAAWDWMQSPEGQRHRHTVDRIRVTLKLRDAGIPGEWAWQAALVLVPDAPSVAPTRSSSADVEV